jgi:hypothetical protein
MFMLGVVVHACIPALGRLKQEDGGLEASLGYIVRPCKKKLKVQHCLWYIVMYQQYI